MSFICPECNREFSSKRALISHRWSHNKKLREETNKKIRNGHRGKSHSEETKRKMSEVWNRPDYQEKMSGKNSSRFGKHHTEETKQKIRDGNIGKHVGNKHPNWKGDNVGYSAIHARVRNRKIKPENCEICGLPEFYENLGRIELSNIRNHQYTDDPNDYQYVHQSCHKKYDSYN